MGPYKLGVCQFPGKNQTKPTAPAWLLKTQPKWIADERIAEVIPWRKADTPITMVRNLAIKTMRALDADYILMIDDDMDPDCEPDGKPFWDVAWEFMVKRREDEAREFWSLWTLHEKDPGWDSPTAMKEVLKKLPAATIAAPYCGPPPWELCYVFQWTNKESNTPDPDFNIEMYTREHAAMMQGIKQVAALPTGLILYDARVFNELPHPYFDYEYHDPPENTRKWTTEDVFQTRNASRLGFPQFCAWDCWAGHVKEKTVRKPAPWAPFGVEDHWADRIKSGQRGGYELKLIGSDNDPPSKDRVMPGEKLHTTSISRACQASTGPSHFPPFPEEIITKK